MVDQLFTHFSFHSKQSIHVFLPIIHQKEPDTWPIIHKLQKIGATVVVSRSDLQDNLLYHYPLTEETILKENKWGIPEPSADSPRFPVLSIDVVLVPLLAFDEVGHRVGYGKGYYDRFLISCRPDVIKIGLSLDSPIGRIEDASPKYDIRLDHCITPSRVYYFNSSRI